MTDGAAAHGADAHSAGSHTAARGGAAAGGDTVQLEDLLRTSGHRVTDARRAVWQALNDADGAHLSVDELTEHITGRAGAVDRASVYRTLGLLKELGLVRATQLSPTDPVRWERSHPDEHFHLQCSACGRVEHHEGDLVARILEHLDVGHGFAVRAVDLTVTGVCAACRRSDSDA